MDDIKNRMYNYETTPPGGVWEAIAAELDANEAKVIPIIKKKNNTFYYIAAASIALIVFCLIFFGNRSSKSNEQLFTSSPDKNDTAINNNLLMTVPIEEKTIAKNNSDNNESLKQNKSRKGLNQSQAKDVIRETDSNLLASNTTSRYITIEGPQGQPVKISSKMVTLIDSSETKISSKPIWHKKINEWREIMKANTLAPTPGNFLDIIELTKSLRDNK
ncbi:MAG: hypothetical protein JWN83_672 [Chitinophagaceae bacterium]|nr:hypothetical protein [Chitinophagaceae bacterium]